MKQNPTNPHNLNPQPAPQLTDPLAITLEQLDAIPLGSDAWVSFPVARVRRTPFMSCADCLFFATTLCPTMRCETAAQYIFQVYAL